MAKRLQGKRALVTGAAQGIGAAIVTAMIEEGADVFAADVNEDGVRALAARVNARPLRLDVACEADWQAAAEMIARDYDGRLTILVHNAGLGLLKPLPETSLAEWRHTMAVNLDGMFLGCRTLQPCLAAAGSRQSPSSVICLSSVAGLIALPDQCAYNVSKSGVRHLAKSLAVEWARHGLAIRCNSIHPGAIRTPLLEAGVEMQLRAGVVEGADEAWGLIAAYSPMAMVGDPRDIAFGAVYLASDEARFVTGAELVIDGGTAVQ
jgi:3(or 17)beta-hydroxysteroid dehydrogenase